MISLKNKIYIYAHYRLSDDSLFYIGKGSNYRALEKRKNQRSKFWYATSSKHGWYFKILEFYESEIEAYEMEEYLVRMLRFCGHKLCNHANGGIGGMKGIPRSEETKLKCSLGNKGKKFTEERKHNISIGRKGKLVNKSTKFNMNKGKKFGPRSEEVKLKISQNRSGIAAWNKGISTGPQDKEVKRRRAKSLIKGRVVAYKEGIEMLTFESMKEARRNGYRVDLVVNVAKIKYDFIWKLENNSISS